MKARTVNYFAKEAVSGLLRNSLMSLTAVVTITLALLLLGSFYMIVTNIDHFADMAKGMLEVRVYLKGNANAVDIQNRILGFPGVSGVEYVSKEQGASWLGKSLGVDDLETYFEKENPLPNMINVKLKDDVSLKKLIAKLETVTGIEEVECGEDFVESMLVTTHLVWAVGICVLCLLALVVLYIVTNTIRLTVMSRRKEIEIMKLVGATDWFVRWPFVFEGLILGAFASVVAVLVVANGYHFFFEYVNTSAPFVPLLSQRLVNKGMFLLVTLSGLGFGLLGSLWSIKRFLKV